MSEKKSTITLIATSFVVFAVLVIIVSIAFSFTYINDLYASDTKATSNLQNFSLISEKRVSPQNNCKGLDVVFLIDESASMEYNDKHALRSSAVKTAIDMLGDNAMYYCPGVHHRISVIGFGNASKSHKATRTYIGSIVISPTIKGLAAWKKYRDEVIKPRIPVTDSLGGTDHLAALKAATRIIGWWKAHPIGDEPRERAIILITDGGPCPYVTEDEHGATKCEWREYKDRMGYLRAMRELADPVGDTLPWRGEDNPDSVSIWMIAFSDSSPTSGYNYMKDQRLLDTWRYIAEKHGGQVYFLPRRANADLANTELSSVVFNVLNPLLGSSLKTWPCDKPVWVQPYMNNIAIVHILKHGANPGVRLEDVQVSIKVKLANGEEETIVSGKSLHKLIKVEDYTEDGPNERYVFYFPPPGEYHIQVEGANICQDLTVELGEKAVKVNVLSPTDGMTLAEVENPPYYDTVTPTFFKAQLLVRTVTSETIPLAIEPGAPITVVAKVQGLGSLKGKADHTYYLKRIDDKNAIYESWNKDLGKAQPIITKNPGSYRWTLSVLTPDIRRYFTHTLGSSYITVAQTTGVFQVVPVEHFSFEIKMPRKNDILPISTNGVPAPVPIEIVLTDEKGVPMAPNEVLLSEGVDTFKVSLVGPDNGIAGGALIRPDFHNNTIKGEVVVNRAAKEGTYRLIVNLLGNYRRNKYAPTVAEQEVTFRRVKPQAVGVDVTSPKENSVFPLINGKAVHPLNVSVRVVDKEHVPLLSQEAFVYPSETTPFKAVLYNENGESLSTALLHLDIKKQAFVGTFEKGKANRIWTPGKYMMRVSLTDNYRKEVFIPLTREVTRTFYMKNVKEISWSIIQPDKEHAVYPLHPTLKCFLPPFRKANVSDLPLKVQVSLTNGHKTPEGSLLKPGKTSLFDGVLSNDKQSADVKFHPIGGKEFFVASWPTKELSAEGTYTLEVTLDKENLSEEFISLEDGPKTVIFERKDSILTKPWACFMLLLLGIILLWDAGIAWLSSGPLRGLYLKFFEYGRDLGGVKLSGAINRRKRTIKAAQLKDVDTSVPALDGLTEVRVSPGAEGTNLHLIWGNEEDSFALDGMQPDDEASIDSGVVVRVEKRKESLLSFVGIVEVVSPLVLWLLAFVYLYITH